MRIPLSPAWLSGYQRSWLRPDVVAGVTVTAYLVPQVMAYAGIAGLSPTTGLWATVGALGIYALLGSSRVLSVGPESTTALMTAAALASVDPGRAPALAVALAASVGVICLLGWLARLSVLAELFSRPVLVGYMAGVAVLMIWSQREAATRSPLASGVVAGTLAVMLLVGWRWRHAPVALVGIVAATLASTAGGLRDRGLEVVGSISGRLPAAGFGAVTVDDLLAMAVPALGIAFVAYTDNVLTGRAFAERRHERVDARRELLALGAANLGAAVLHGFPVSSSGSRTAIADAAGARSQLAGFVTLGSVLLVTLALAPLVAVVPIAGLSAVVVLAALRIVDLPELRRLARFRSSELTLALTTTMAVLVLDVLYGVIVAVALSCLDLLRRVARPHDAVLGFVPGLAGMHDIDDYADVRTVPGLVVYRYDSPLFFANAEDFRQRALAAVDAADPPARWLVLNTEAWSTVDITGCDALESLRAQLADRGVALALARVKQDLRLRLEHTALIERIGTHRVFPTLPTAVAAFRGEQGQPSSSSAQPR